MSVTVHHGDMRAILPTLETRFHAVVTDPPYHLASIVKRFGAEGAAPAKGEGVNGAYARASRGFMGKQWDGGQIAFEPETWAAVGAVMRPGAHLVAFGGTKGFHRMACAIEDAGFEIRDTLAWLYGTGFPKSLDAAKAIDKSKGTPGRKVPAGAPVKRMIPGADQARDGWAKTNGREYQPGDYEPGSEEAAAWSGWGTALKPAFEPIILARWPMIGSVAANLEAHGTGALNIDGCRIESDAPIPTPGATRPTQVSGRHGIFGLDKRTTRQMEWEPNKAGRWPANVVHDGSDEVVSAFPDAGGNTWRNSKGAGLGYGSTSDSPRGEVGFRDSGSAARFFYSAKADADDRLASKHPTVKPVDLMRWLVRLVTPRGGLVLDPFAGSGSTAMACMAEGFDCHLIEREAEYVADIRRRIAHVSGMDTPLFAE